MRIAKYLVNGKVDVVETPKPEADEGHVVIKVKASAVCGSELNSMRNGMGDGRGFNAGHEVVGIVESAPVDSGFEKGMRVGARIVQGCGICRYCAIGRETACSNKKFYAGDAHAEYFKLGLSGAHVLPDGIDWPEAVLLAGDGLGVPARAAARLGDTRGKKILIVGLGPVGLANVMVQSFNGADVIGSDPLDYRRNLALELGAKFAIDPLNGDSIARIAEWTDGVGVDIAILAVGREDALQACAEALSHQGTLFQVAEFSEATINPSAMFVQKELTMTGSWYFTSADWPTMLKYHKNGLPLKKLITHVFPFERIQEAVETFLAGKSGKVVLTY